VEIEEGKDAVSAAAHSRLGCGKEEVGWREKTRREGVGGDLGE
jgi:hypothetical protein